MRTVDIIHKKREGLELTTEEISFLVGGYVKGQIPDYQMSAWAMAVFFKGMTARETADLTIAMAQSGDMINLSDIHGVKVDKHSTGGVGDKVTLVLGPLVAAAGVPVAKMSGRGLGHTGGTIDKLESIPGFHVELSREQFMQQVNTIGLAVIGQSGNITPADKKLYGLRDVTATVDSIPLIASSIMSKKIAAGADAIVLDVKTGSGAFMKSLDDSIRLAQAMVEIGEHVGRRTIAVISDMDQPLGYNIGNAVEVSEALATLKGHGPADLMELCLTIGGHMLVLGGKAATAEEGRTILTGLIENGEALHKFGQFIAAQGGSAEVAGDTSLLPSAPRRISVESTVDGYVHAIEAESIGTAAMMLGAGRETKEAAIDVSVGLELKRKVGDYVKAGEQLAVMHAADTASEDRLKAVAARVVEAYVMKEAQPAAPKLVYAVVTKDGVERMA